MVVSPTEVSFGNRGLAERAVSELDPSVSARRVRTDHVFTMMNAVVDDKVSSLWK